MPRVISLEYYQLPLKIQFNEGKQKFYPTHKRLAQFQICSACAWIGHFRNKKLEKLTNSELYIIPEKDRHFQIEYKKGDKTTCLYCNSEIQKLIIQENREVLGFFCYFHKKMFCFPIEPIDWKRSQYQSRDKTGGVLIKGEEKKSIFQKIILPYTPIGFGEPIPKFDYKTYAIPRTKTKSIDKWLKAKGCQFIR